MNRDVKTCQPNVQFNYGVFNKTLHVTQNFNNFDSKLKHKLSLVNVHLLGSSYVSKLAEVLNEGNCLHNFFRRERMISKRHGSGFYFTKIVIKKHHVALIKQILDHDRNDLGMGRVFLFQAVTSGVIVSAYSLAKVLDHQVAPKSDILLDDDNILYAFPYYNRIDQHSLINYNSVRYSRKEIPRMEEKLVVSNGISDRVFDFIAFLCDDRDITFGEFLESPVFDFSREVEVRSLGDSAGESRFEELYDAQRWFIQYSELFEVDSILGLDRHEIMLIVDCVVGIYGVVVQANVSSNQKWKLSIQDFNHFLVSVSDEKRNSVSKTLSRLSKVMNSTLDVDLMIYYCYYLLLNNSSSEVNELLDVFDDQENQIVFLQRAKLNQIMGYYTNERTMSLDMWIVLNDLIEESV